MNWEQYTWNGALKELNMRFPLGTKEISKLRAQRFFNLWLKHVYPLQRNEKNRETEQVG